MGTVIFRYIIRLTVLAVLLVLRNVLERNKESLHGLYDVLHSLTSFSILFTIVNLVAAALIMIYRLRKNIPYKYTDNVINGINNLYYLIVTFGFLLMIPGFWGIDLKSLITSLSIVAAAIAIISKDFVTNIISGIIISFSKEINIEDYVMVGNHKGKILDINLSKITLMNDDDDIIYIPNDKVYTAEVINYTKKEIRKISIDFELPLPNNISIEELEKNLEESLKEYSKYIEPNSFNIKIVDLHHEYLSLKFQCKLTEVNRDVEKMIRKHAVRYIANLLRS